jgi:hypothetical protein
VQVAGRAGAPSDGHGRLLTVRALDRLPAGTAGVEHACVRPPDRFVAGLPGQRDCAPVAEAQAGGGVAVAGASLARRGPLPELRGAEQALAPDERRMARWEALAGEAQRYADQRGE